MRFPKILVCAVIICLILGCSSNDPKFNGTELTNLETTDFTLTDQFGKPFTLSDNFGKVILLFFGFTYCPDVCPLTLSTWKKVQDELQEHSEHLKFVYITVDPERDTEEKLREHLSIFSQDFIGLSGKQEDLLPVYEGYGVFREKVTISESAAGYLMSHTSRIYVIDRSGRWRLSISHDTPVEDLVDDLKILLNEKN